MVRARGDLRRVKSKGRYSQGVRELSRPMEEEASRVLLLGKPGCHLCETVEAELRSVRGLSARLIVVDVDTDRTLYDRYLLRIPIVTVDGEVIFEGSMMDLRGEWKEKLLAALGLAEESR